MCVDVGRRLIFYLITLPFVDLLTGQPPIPRRFAKSLPISCHSLPLTLLASTTQCVKLIREAGGIVFVKTNVPQTMLSFECSNPVWGRTLHPLKSTATGSPLKNTKVPAAEQERRFTSGGSSGGEAALLASDGTALGLGSDIGGSLRIPTAFCGIYALKPSPGRTSSLGTTGAPNTWRAFHIPCLTLIMQILRLGSTPSLFLRAQWAGMSLWFQRYFCG